MASYYFKLFYYFNLPNLLFQWYHNDKKFHLSKRISSVLHQSLVLWGKSFWLKMKPEPACYDLIITNSLPPRIY